MKLYLRLLYFLLPLFILLAVQANPRLERVPNDLIPEAKPPLQDTNQKILPLDLRSLSDWKLSDLLLVSDIDGNLHGVERNTGTFLWSLPIDEPLVKIQKSESKTNIDGSESNLLWFVEPAHDGSLFYFSPLYGLNKLPTSIKDLVMESPFSLSGDNKIYTGARKTSLYTINLNTGQIVSHFGTTEEEECPVPNVYGTPRFTSGKEGRIIMIGKTTYELSIHSKIDSNLVWNVTYSQWGPNNIDNDLIMQHVQSIDNLYFTPFHDKSLLAVNRNIGTPAWISKLPSLAVNVFDVFSNKDEFVVLPHPSKVLNDLQLRSGESEYGNNDLCFVNKTANGREWFAMSFPNFPTLLKSAPVSQYQLALYQYDNGILDDTKVNYLSGFDVSHPEAELFISGVHKINHLGPENLYQPISKFKKITRQIGDGSNSHAEPPIPTQGQLQQIPSLMDGILFPNTPEHVRQDLSTVDRDGNDLYNDAGHRSKVPANFYSDDVRIDKSPLHRLSVFRRITEDLLVMSTLLLFLLAFGKVNQIIKNKDEKAVRFVPGDEKPVTMEAGIPFKEKKQSIETDSETNEETSEDPLAEKHEMTSKKVKIVAPEDTLGDDVLTIVNEQITNDKPIEDDENDSPSGTKKKRKRGSRGGKRGGKGKKSANKDDEDFRIELPEPAKELDDKSDQADEEDDDIQEAIQTTSLVKNIIKPSTQAKKLQIDNNLIITDKILGYGSHGTVVYEGSFENRPVAVKRMLLDFYDIANHEVRLLQESDDHPNVIRYFCSQSSESEKFLYIALELCVCSLEDIIEKPKSYPESLWINLSSYNEVLLQLASGLNYLHSLKIVHRDLKPQNILVGEATRKNLKLKTASATIRLLISDFGLCKKLDADQSSFRATTQHAASGTSGWRAPELLLHHDLSEVSSDTVSSNGSTSRHSIKDGSGSLYGGQGKRLTKAIDIFSLGCVFYYIFSGGGHPFGERYLREGNIIHGEYNLAPLSDFCPDDFVEATDLIESMIAFNPKLRPDTVTILKHPYFWNYNKKLDFLLKVSDRFEIERRDPPSDLLLELELVGQRVHNNDWLAKFDVVFIENLGKYRKYNTEKVMDLLRALRNKYHHYNDMPSGLQAKMSPLPHGFYRYFNRKFPSLLMEIYYVVKSNLKDEHVFQEYY